MIDPVGGALLKAGAGALPMTIKAVAQEWSRRNADEATFAALEVEMNEALDVLADRDGIVKALMNRGKALVSGVPPVFDLPAIRAWLGQDATRSAVKAAAHAIMLRAPADRIAAASDGAVHLEAELREPARVAFDYAVAFVLRTIDRTLTPGDRLVQARFDQLEALIERRQGEPPESGLSRHLLDQEATRAIERLRQRRFFFGVDPSKETRELITRLTDGDLRSASEEVRSRGLACAARWLSRQEDAGDEASRALEVAVALGDGEEVTIARAFLALPLGQASALAHLHPIATPARREAALAITVAATDWRAGLDWVDTAQIQTDEFTPDGKRFLLTIALEVGEWARAASIVDALGPEDFTATPAILPLAGYVKLSAAVPADLRHLVRQGPPVDAATFALGEDATALQKRREAVALYQQAAEAARALDISKIASLYDIYALWLRLRDPTSESEARSELYARLDDSDRVFAIIPLAVAFDVSFDVERVEGELDRRAALNPLDGDEAAMARFTLLTLAKDAAQGLASLRKHREGLAPFINPDVIVGLEFQFLLGLGRRDDARALLSNHEKDIQPALRQRMQLALRDGATGPTIDDLEAWYAADPNTLNLRPLVERLQRADYTPRYFELARKLVAATRVAADAEMVVNRLIEADRHDEVGVFLDDVAPLLPSSLPLQGAKAWDQFRRGDIASAWTALQTLRTARDDRNDRALLVNILISSGRWADLAGHLETEWERRADRSAHELVELAKLAAAAGSTRALGFAEAAVAAAPSDPHVLAQAYTTAVTVGVESGSTTQWLQGAIERSGEDGPMQIADLQELVARGEDWRRLNDEVWAKVRAGEMPLFGAAKLLNRSWLELHLAPLLLNPEEPDPRQRSVVPAYSGVRGTVAFQEGPIALDGSSIATLGALGVLKSVIERPGGVFVPHSTLATFFAERQKLRFHQPSRIKEAHALIQDLSLKRLFAFTTTATPPVALVDAVGQDLAEMLATARSAEPGVQHLVVRSAPISRIGSLSGEEADLGEAANVVVSCSTVIDRLVLDGRLTGAEEERARSYLEHQKERRWPDEAAIADGASLYLDDLSVSYLRTIGVLDRLKAAGLTAFVSGHEIDEANTLLKLEAHGERIEATIDSIRADLANGIESGAVRLTPMVEGDEVASHPNVAVMRLITKVDVIVSDERAINRNRRIQEGDNSAEIWTSLDLLAQLTAALVLTPQQHVRARTDLRRGGFVLVGPTHEELSTLVAKAKVHDGRLQETVELRAIRENLELAQMRRWLHLPTEAGWLNALQEAAVDAIVDQWNGAVSDKDARIRATWLLQRADVRNWAGLYDGTDFTTMAGRGLTFPLVRLLLARPSDLALAQRLATWLEEMIDTLKDAEPATHRWMMAYLRELILMGAAADVEAGDA